MNSKLINKYENLLLQIHEQFDDNDLNELSELIALMVNSGRTRHAAAVLRLALFYQPEVPELWTKMGDIQALNARFDESTAAHREARRLMKNRLCVMDYAYDGETKVLLLPPPFVSEAAYAT